MAREKMGGRIKSFAERLFFLSVTWTERKFPGWTVAQSIIDTSDYERKRFGAPDKQGVNASIFIPLMALLALSLP